jgi:hypothetical protein
MGAAIGGSAVVYHRWSGGLTVNNLASGDVLKISSVSGGAVTLNGADATVHVRGMVIVTNSLTGTPSVTLTQVVNQETINTEADTALRDANLDHLVKVAVDTNWATTVTKNSVVDYLTSKDTNQTFDRATDSTEAVRDKLPTNLEDLSIVDTTGLVDITQAAADKVWGTAARVLTAGTNLNNISTADVLAQTGAALDVAFDDSTVLTSNGLKDRMRTYGWINRNKMTVVDASGNTVIYKDNSSTAGFTVAGLLTDDSTTTTRLRVA